MHILYEIRPNSAKHAGHYAVRNKYISVVLCSDYNLYDAFRTITVNLMINSNNDDNLLL